MTRTSRTVGIGIVFVCGLLVSSGSKLHAGTVYSFVFDNNGLAGPPASPPFVGFGTVTVGFDPGPGFFRLDSLGGFSMMFNFSDDVFTEADIQTTVGTIEVLVTDLGNSAEQLNFTNKYTFGDGPNFGAIDFQNRLGQQLSFSPPGSGADYLYYETGQNFFGNYLSTIPTLASPSPSNATLCVSGALVFAGLTARRTIQSIRIANELMEIRENSTAKRLACKRLSFAPSGQIYSIGNLRVSRFFRKAWLARPSALAEAAPRYWCD